jgi:hypothetical protein
LRNLIERIDIVWKVLRIPAGIETGRPQKKGGDNQIGHHLPGWGGVLLGKLNQ